ncbi:signal peptidase I [Streptomyces sp. NPDC050388]|uniref:signal peptidase I n=1 Tax=Streptomyces sp. NPDC050388 TaxID=3155781 RepID=UPI0034402284
MLMWQRRTIARLRDVAWVLAPFGLALLVGAIVYTLANYKTVTIMGDSMRPTFRPGDRPLIEQIDATEIRRGDVVLIDAPEHYQTGGPALRRVIGTGGDHVAGAGNRVTVNGRPLDEPYVTDVHEDLGVVPYDVKVPEGRLFVLGDHRANSNDSRYHLSEQSGSLAASGVQGRVVENSAAPTVLVAIGSLGMVLTLLGIGGHIARRRAQRSLQPAAPWPVA